VAKLLILKVFSFKIMNYPIYLDYAATTPMDKRVLEVMLPYFTQHFGNAGSRQHAYGWVAAEAVATARRQVADCIGAAAKEIIFTSGATEAINLAIKGTFQSSSREKKHIITITTEHKATLEVCKSLESQGIEVSYLPVDSRGTLDLNILKNTIQENTILISLLWGNNETGVIHPIKDITAIAHASNILVHVDATQTVGKIPVSVTELSIDLLSFSSHKIYGPKGVGALFIKKGVSVLSQQHGGGQERNLRGGTLNISGIVGFGEACKLASEEIEENKRIEKLRDLLEALLQEKLSGIQINNQHADRLSHISNISFPKADGEELLMRLNKIAISNGSACNSAATEPSHVLKAMGLSNELAYASVRFSLGRFTNDEDIHTAASHVISVYHSIINS
jgi:cysteine desulfurase